MVIIATLAVLGVLAVLRGLSVTTTGKELSVALAGIGYTLIGAGMLIVAALLA